MFCKNIAISKWILIFTFSHVSCYIILQFKDLDEKRITNLINTVTDAKVLQDKQLEKTHDTASHLQNSRKNLDIHDFKYKTLIKRIVPHDYELKEFEYDAKYNTLFKPLFRVHKRKPDLDESRSGEDRFDLIYIVDDESLKGASHLDKDFDLLNPFTIDNMEIKNLPNENAIEFFINKNKDKGNIEHSVDKNNEDLDADTYSPNNEFSEFGLSRYLEGNKNEMEYNNKNRLLNFYLDDDKLKEVLENQKESWVKYDNPTKSEIYDLLFKIVNSSKKKPGGKPKKRRFSTVGQFVSQEFKPEQDLNVRVVNSFHSKSDTKNNKKYLNRVEQLHQGIEKLTSTNNAKDTLGSLSWFGPMGNMNSKQLHKYNRHAADNTIQEFTKAYNYGQLRNHQPDYSNPLLQKLKTVENRQRKQTNFKFNDVDNSMVHNYGESKYHQADNRNNLLNTLKKIIQQQQKRITDGNNDNSKVYDYGELKYKPEKNEKLFGTLKQIIQQKKTETSSIESEDSKALENTRELVGSLENINSNHIMHDDWKYATQLEPVYFLTKNEFNHNKKELNKLNFKLNVVDQMPHILAKKDEIKLDKNNKKRNPSHSEDLRTKNVFARSDESDEEMLQGPKLPVYDEIVTTEAVTWKPRYPYWNSWTYDKQIVVDDCKGKLVQNGKLCVGAWA